MMQLDCHLLLFGMRYSCKWRRDVTATPSLIVNSSNDFINSEGIFDPKHLFGASNFDVFRWPALTQGRERQMLATFITAVIMPGIPLYYYGEEQGMYLFDNDADNFLYGWVSSLFYSDYGTADTFLVVGNLCSPIPPGRKPDATLSVPRTSSISHWNEGLQVAKMSGMISITTM